MAVPPNKPHVEVSVMAQPKLKDGVGCSVKQKSRPYSISIKEGHSHAFILKDPSDQLEILPRSERMAVKVQNETSVPLYLVQKIGDDELDDVIKQGRGKWLDSRAKVTVRL